VKSTKNLGLGCRDLALQFEGCGTQVQHARPAVGAMVPNAGK
jgi:hypothetical protein